MCLRLGKQFDLHADITASCILGGNGTSNFSGNLVKSGCVAITVRCSPILLAAGYLLCRVTLICRSRKPDGGGWIS